MLVQIQDKANIIVQNIGARRAIFLAERTATVFRKIYLKNNLKTPLPKEQQQQK
jgi:hypothetical protein